MNIIEEIKHRFEKGESLKRISQDTGISFGKIRKILISEGVLRYPLTNKILALKAQGLSMQEISDRLNCSKQKVNNYLPYGRVIYKYNQSNNALTIKRWRQNKNKEE